MNINEFVSQYTNHPVLFVGTGISLRYLNNSFTWDGLLKKVAKDFKGNDEYYYDVKSSCEKDGEYDYPKLAELIESDFNLALQAERQGKFEAINDLFYDGMEKDVNYSRFKLYLVSILEELVFREEMSEEIRELKKVRKNIASVITTNYDSLIEHIFEFSSLVGNDILLSNPYGSVYKIHGCVTDPLKIIVTESDYQKFDEKYELIRAQLLSIFIHNPIIFIGYNVGDENIKSILKTIFTYVEPNSDEADRIRGNFLLVEREAGSESLTISEHDIVLDDRATIRINKLKTDNFKEVYSALSDLNLPVSAMDVRKVQNIFHEIRSGGEIQVNITEDLDSLDNKDKIIAIGSAKTVNYTHQSTALMMRDYFRIIEESNSQRLSLINQMTIASTQWFPVYAFDSIYSEIQNIDVKKENQKQKIENIVNQANNRCKSQHTSIVEIFGDVNITPSKKYIAVIWSLLNDNLELDDVEAHLLNYENKNDTDYRRLLCGYDLKRYG